jgi:hypothetical protein
MQDLSTLRVLLLTAVPSSPLWPDRLPSGRVRHARLHSASPSSESQVGQLEMVDLVCRVQRGSEVGVHAAANHETANAMTVASQHSLDPSGVGCNLTEGFAGRPDVLEFHHDEPARPSLQSRSIRPAGAAHKLTCWESCVGIVP